MIREVTPDDGYAAFVLYQCYRERIDYGLEEFKRMTVGIQLGYMVVGDEVVGVASRKNGMLHIGVIECWRSRWATKGFIRRIKEWAAESGPVHTGVVFGNSKGMRLVEGVGFTRTGVMGNGVTYELSSNAI